ncbi:MAG: hypothetical protein AB1757_12380 [Acidobacteriota bacterium]
MKNLVIISALFITFVLIGAVQTKAQAATRIQFAKGKSSATLKANTGSYGATYVVRVSPAQKMVVTLTPTAKVGIKVATEGTDAEQVLLKKARGGTYEIILEEGGDYTLFIGSNNNRPVPFTLTVKITNLTDI